MDTKRMLSLVLSIVLAVQMLPVAASAKADSRDAAPAEQAAGVNIGEDGGNSESDPETENNFYQDTNSGDNIISEPPILTVSPGTISEGTVNPSVTISSSLSFLDTSWTREHLSVYTGETGLVLKDAFVERDLTLIFEGTASVGTISGILYEGAFGTGTAAASFSIQVVPAQQETDTGTVLFIANNDTEERALARVNIGHNDFVNMS